jgi:anti-sigma regulatory factor (Ser/Thr protein kinase)
MSGSWTGHNGAGGAPGRSRDGLVQAFDGNSLVALRSAVAAHGGLFGLTDTQVEDLVLAAHELASNAVRHGGGQGRLRMWQMNGSVYCEIADGGDGFSYPRPDGDRRPPVGATGGRGLWIVAQLVDVLQVTTGVDGTVALVQVRTPATD